MLCQISIAPRTLSQVCQYETHIKRLADIFSVDTLIRKTEKALKELRKREQVVKDLSKDVDDRTQQEWNEIRQDIERHRAKPMPSDQRRRGVRDEYGPRSVDGLLETAEKGDYPEGKL